MAAPRRMREDSERAQARRAYKKEEREREGERKQQKERERKEERERKRERTRKREKERKRVGRLSGLGSQGLENGLALFPGVL